MDYATRVIMHLQYFSEDDCSDKDTFDIHVTSEDEFIRVSNHDSLLEIEGEPENQNDVVKGPESNSEDM
ncbi:hypothetical protein NPIL_170101 [Nephila pilipes]|uniref:Uncharacterized protein n=1 Tax=Nephila pilipes TaxID=299642 RepID=A0A8X6NWG6_NEPPI|nr:hypothetical protein NPIL_170101 [Nephila pilipes]